VPLGWFAGRRINLQIGADGRILAVGSKGLFDNRVQDSVAANRRRAGVGQQRKADPMALGEISQDLLGVVADSCYMDPLLAELFETTLQLDELRAAERSPVGRAEEHQHRAARPHDRLQVAHAAGLVSEVEIRNSLSHLRAQLGDLDFLARLLRCLCGVRTTHTEHGEECCQRRQATRLRHGFNQRSV
jgi:hypothetical protein